MKTKKQILHTTGADGIRYKIEVVTKTKKHLKEGVKIAVVMVLLTIAMAFILYTDAKRTENAVNQCRTATNNAYYCDDLK